MDGYSEFPGDAQATRPQLKNSADDGFLARTDPSPLTGSTEEKISFWTLFKKHKLSVLVDCLVFGVFGMGVAFLGPFLFDLGCQTGSDLKKMSWVFFVQLLMTMIGSISAGFLAGRLVPAHILLCIGVTGLPITMFLIPACTVFAGLLIDLIVMGWFMGCVDCVANLRMILRFGTNVTPFLQALHFFYGLGAFVSPMIASPFLLNIDCSPFLDGFHLDGSESELGAVNETVTVAPQPQVVERAVHLSHSKEAFFILGTIQRLGAWCCNETVTVAPQPQVVERAVHLSHSKEAFFILGTIQLLITIVVFLVVILERKWGIIYSPAATPTHGGAGHPDDAEDISEYSGSKFMARCFHCGSRELVFVTILASASLFIYDGVQSSYADYIYSYAEKNVKGLKRSEGAILNSCFWGTFALGRLIAIVVSTYLSAAFMLSLNICGCAFALLITLIGQTSRVAIYLGTCSLGFFLSSLSPTAMALTEQFIKINAPITSCLVVFAALGETICPVIVGNLFQSAGEVSLLVFCFVIVIGSLVLFAKLFLTGRDTPRYREKCGTSFIWVAKPSAATNESMEISPTSVPYYNTQPGDTPGAAH